jgi:hypothetical protein
MNRAWIAPLGTGPDGPGGTEVGTEVGTAGHDGLVIIDDLPQAGPPIQWPATLIFQRDRRAGRTRVFSDDGTPGSRRRLAKECARFDRDALAIRWPYASRVKREYHRRRR